MARILPFLLGLALVALPLTAGAQSNWTGAVDTDWTNAGNWDAGVPNGATNGIVTAVSPATATISGGITAQAQNLIVGWDEGLVYGTTTGTANVTGAGTALNVGTLLSIGQYNGVNIPTGTLTVNNGAAVTAPTIEVGSSSWSGIPNVNGNPILGSPPLGTGIVTLSNNSTMSATDLYVGYGGSGTLTVQSGSTLNTTNAYLGTQKVDDFVAPKLSDVTITGTGSTWNNTSAMYIGHVTNPGGCPTLELFCHRVQSTVTLTNNAVLNADAIIIGRAENTGIGDVSNLFGVLTLNNGATLNANSLALGSLDAGLTSNATLNLGGAVGDPAQAIGTLNIANNTITGGIGGNSVVNFNHTDTDYQFGTILSGNLTVNHNAGVTSFIANSNYANTTVNGGTLTFDANTIVNTGGTSQTGGSFIVTNNTDLTTGSLSVTGGTTTIEDGSTVSSLGTLGVGNTGAEIVIKDAGTTVSVATNVNVEFGGTLTIQDQADLTSSGIASIYGLDPLVSTANVDGVGSSWVHTGDLIVGANAFFIWNTDTGNLNITDGGAVSATNASIGQEAKGNVIIDGTGSVLSVTNDLSIGSMNYGFGFGGFSSIGTLTVSNGGDLTAPNIIMGNADPLLVFDPNATWRGVLNIGGATNAAATNVGTFNIATIGTSGNAFSSGIINFNHTNTGLDFDADISGDIDVNQIAGTTILNGTNTYDGDTTITGGRLIVDRSITSDTLIGVNGLLGGEGSVGDVTNNGRLEPGALLANGTYGTLTIAGNYIGNAGSSLYLKTFLDDNTSPSDVLVINGGTTAGTTDLFVTITGGSGAQTTGEGIKLIDVINGGTIDPTTFRLANTLKAGKYTYRLAQAISGQALFLQSFTNMALSAYALAPQLAGFIAQETVGTLHDRVTQDDYFFKQNYSYGGVNQRTAASQGMWMRSFGGVHDFKTQDDLHSSYSATSGTVQIGKDLFRTITKGKTTHHAGLYLAQSRTNAAMRSINGNEGKANFSNTSGGGYWTAYGKHGTYVDSVVQYSRIGQLNATTNDGNHISPKAESMIASVEVGQAIPLSPKTMIEPELQAIYQRMRIDDDNDGSIAVHYKDLDTVTGRAGLRVVHKRITESGLNVQPWGRVNVAHTLDADSEMVLDGTDTIKTPIGNTMGEVQLGVTMGRVSHMGTGWSLYGAGGYAFALGGAESSGWTGTVGVKVNW